MYTLFDSFLGHIGTALLHTALLLGMLVLAIFKPERIGSWLSFRLSVVLFISAVALPGIISLFPTDSQTVNPLDQWISQLALTVSGLLTAMSIYFLMSCFSKGKAKDIS